MKTFVALASAAALTFCLSTPAMAHCGKCAAKDGKTHAGHCKKKCAKAKDKKACKARCKKKNAKHGH